MLRALLDTNAVDAITEEPRWTPVSTAVETGRLELLWTHINIDELAAIPDEEHRARMLTIAASVCRFIPTGIFVIGYSRLDSARLCDDGEAYEAMQAGNLKRTRDAILGATAIFEACPLVTFDGPLAGRARARGVEVWTPDELIERLA